MDHHAMLRVLLAEDDAVSLAFLAETLHGLGFEAHAIADGESALEIARAQRFDALVLDRHLPGLNGDRILQALHADPQALSRNAMAIATTAEPDPEIHALLRKAGFVRVLTKPLDAASLREAFQELGIACACVSPDSAFPLDDEAGMRASGSSQALSTLRGLFARELDTLAQEWKGLREDAFALAERLHRLRASCGFCGALALQSAAAKLSDALRAAEPMRIEQARMEFQQALAATRAALGT